MDVARSQIPSPGHVTPATQEKREKFQAFVAQLLASETAVKGVVGIGSIAMGHMRADSDVDAVVFLEPFDLYIVPAEAIWYPVEDTFYSIFQTRYLAAGLQVDLLRLPWQKWSAPDFAWPEERRAELSGGWLAYDPSGDVARLIADKCAYDEVLRLERLDEAVIWLDELLGEDTPEHVWTNLGPLVAHDRAQAAYRNLVNGLFAYNRRWRIWRNREMGALLALPWLPPDFPTRAVTAVAAPTPDFDGYMTRITTLRALFADFLQQLIAAGDYSPMPIDQAFLRRHEEPGRAWNLEEWNKFRIARKL